MKAKREYRNRDETEVAILDALVNRAEDGMTVFELRAAVSAEIDDLEEALATLKADTLIVVEKRGQRTVIKPHERVVPEVDENPDRTTIGEWIRKRIPF